MLWSEPAELLKLDLPTKGVRRRPSGVSYVPGGRISILNLCTCCVHMSCGNSSFRIVECVDCLGGPKVYLDALSARPSRLTLDAQHALAAAFSGVCSVACLEVCRSVFVFRATPHGSFLRMVWTRIVCAEYRSFLL